MAEGLGAAASAIAVIELAAKVTALCLEYSSAVKNAKSDIERLREQVRILKVTVERAQSLLNGPHGARLKASQKLGDLLKDSHSQLGDIATRLEDKLGSGRTKAMRSFGLRALKWPFESKDLDAIIEKLQRIQAIFSNTLQIDQTAEILEINQKIDLSKLPVAAGAAFDSQANEHNSRCHPDTRVDLLAQVYKWFEKPDGKCIFWLRGMAGTGKSTISRTVAEYVSAKKIPIASYFFKKGEGDRSKSDKFFTTIVAQLVHQVPCLATHIRTAIENEPSISDKSKREQLEKLIMEPLYKCVDDPRKPTLIAVVIDALDECDREEDAKAIIRLLSRAKEATGVRMRFFVTSRPELSIRLGFNDIGDSYENLALHEVPKPDIERDISTFVRFRLEHIRDDFNKTLPQDLRLPEDWPCSTDLQSLIHMAVPLFIFASTACRFIDDRSCGDPQEQMEKILTYQKTGGSTRLEATYLPILNQLLLKHTDSGLRMRSEDEKLDILAWFNKIVGSIIVLAQPLSVVSLARLLGESSRGIISKLDRLHSVIDIPEDQHHPVRLFHLSFRDFLIDDKDHNRHSFQVNEQEIHIQLAMQCLQLLSTDNALRRDICTLREPGTRRSDIEQHTIDRCIPPAVQYACLYWVYHLKQGQRTIQDGDAAHTFLACHFLHWLEAVGIMGHAMESVAMVDDLSRLIEPINSKSVTSFLHDAKRVVMHNCGIIDEAPLQVYHSVTLFAPESSEVRRMFRDQTPGWLSGPPKVDSNWHPLVQTLHHHRRPVTAVAFSPDGRLVASGSRDATTKLWDVATGVCMVTLHHDFQANSVAFSPDSRQLAAGSYDGTIKLWDVATGYMATYNHGEPVNVVVFSPDGRQLAAGSYYGTIKLWDLTTGYMTTYDHGESVNSVVFSPDGRNIASGSDRTLKLWDVATGDCAATFEHFGPVRLAALSPDGQQVASGSDQTVEFWDASTSGYATIFSCFNSVGSITFLLDGYLVAAESENKTARWETTRGNRIMTFENGSIVTSIAFSPDGCKLASGSDDGTVKLWDTTAGRYVTTSNISIGRIVFSPDGHKVAWTFNNGNVEIWDTRTREIATTLNHSEIVDTIMFSPDGRQLASISADEIVKIWDTATGSNISTLKQAESERVNLVTFSPDGCQLASGSNDGFVKVWDTATGSDMNTFYPGRMVNSVMFSPDGLRVASGSNDGYVNIWDTVTGGNIAAFKQGKNEKVNSVTFSPDGRQVASGSNEGFVKIWDTAMDSDGTTLDHGQWVSSITFSPNGSQLVSGSGLGTVKLWDAVTYSCITKLDGQGPASSITFSPNGSHLYTDHNSFALFSPSENIQTKPQSHYSRRLALTAQGIGLSKNRDWITWNGHDILWLPPAYRPLQAVVNASTVVLGCPSGRVIMMTFSVKDVPFK